MKLETSQDLLNRVREKHHASWYGLAKLLPAHENTVYSWKGGRTVVDRKFAPRIAELLGESAEYVLACLEADREQDAEVLKVWERIATKFRGHAASVLLVSMLMSGVGTAGKAEASQPYPAEGHASVCILCHLEDADGSGGSSRPGSRSRRNSPPQFCGAIGRYNAA